ncbi:MAG TPA: ATP-binding protein [Actinomycetota bacterium]|nr:ATP-binding protein [Actinomycetota bacterium]
MDRSAKFAWLVVAAAIALLATLWADQRPSPELLSILFWVALLAAIELLPMYMGFKIELTLGFVIILPVVILFPTPVAMVIVGLGSVDPRELRGDLPLHKALFNRAQSMLAAAAATIPFAVLDAPRFSVGGVVLAALIHLVVNLGLVALAVRIERGTPLREILEHLVPRPVIGFGISYGLLTGLGAATALVYSREQGGGWAVAAILIPLLFARLSILGARNQQELSERLRKQQQALLEATERIFQAREDERKNIAATIHDSSLQSLAGAAYACGNARDALGRGDTHAARELLTRARGAIDEATASIRSSVLDLRKSSVEEGGLMETIRKFADNVATLWGAEVRIEGDITHEPPVPVSLAAFQILQEGLVNSLKHSGSESVIVRVSEIEGKVQIVVEDHGTGFDPQTAVGEGQLGVDLMKARAATLGGSVELDSAPGRGTRLVAVLPSGVEL